MCREAQLQIQQSKTHYLMSSGPLVNNLKHVAELVNLWKNYTEILLISQITSDSATLFYYVSKVLLATEAPS